MKLLLSLLAVAFAAPFSYSQTFVEDVTVPFVGLQSADVEWADVDGDGDLDVAMGGSNANNDPILSLYLNDGNGGFTLSDQTAFAGHLDCELAFLDADGDEDLDLIAMGWDGMYNIELYANDGNGAFSIVNDSGLSGMGFGDLQVGDIDGDGDVDVVTSGQISPYEIVTHLYRNDGLGFFEEQLGTGLLNLAMGETELGDIDGDGDLDLLITGRDFDNDELTSLYLNDGSGTFDFQSSGLPGVAQGDLDFVDLDGDNDLDLMFSGVGGGMEETQLYENDGSGAFTVSQSDFPQVFNSSHAFADVDGDNDLDMVLTGADGNQNITQLYLNDGSGSYTLVENTPFDGHQSGEVTWADVDGDGDPDLLLVGFNQFNQKIAKLYLNDGIVGVEERIEVDAWELYPNPARNYIMLPEGARLIHVFDGLGSASLVTDSARRVDVSELPSGMYTMIAELNGKLYSRAFIKE